MYIIHPYQDYLLKLLFYFTTLILYILESQSHMYKTEVTLPLKTELENVLVSLKIFLFSCNAVCLVIYDTITLYTLSKFPLKALTM